MYSANKKLTRYKGGIWSNEKYFQRNSTQLCISTLQLDVEKWDN